MTKSLSRHFARSFAWLSVQLEGRDRTIRCSVGQQSSGITLGPAFVLGSRHQLHTVRSLNHHFRVFRRGRGERVT